MCGRGTLLGIICSNSLLHTQLSVCALVTPSTLRSPSSVLIRVLSARHAHPPDLTWRSTPPDRRPSRRVCSSQSPLPRAATGTAASTRRSSSTLASHGWRWVLLLLPYLVARKVVCIGAAEDVGCAVRALGLTKLYSHTWRNWVWALHRLQGVFVVSDSRVCTGLGRPGCWV